MNHIHISSHPLILRDLGILRDSATRCDEFRSAMRRASAFLAYEAAADLPITETKITTPLGTAQGHRINYPIVIVPILRAGLGMLDAFMEVFPTAVVGHLGLYRDEETLSPVEYYSNFPDNIEGAVVFILDPLLATGGTAVAAIDYIKQTLPSRVSLISIITAPQAIALVTNLYPDVHLYTAAIDKELNSAGAIVPGLGDAGDRLYGTGLSRNRLP